MQDSYNQYRGSDQPEAISPTTTPQSISTAVAAAPRPPGGGPNEVPPPAEVLEQIKGLGRTDYRKRTTYLIGLAGQAVTGWDGWVISPPVVPAGKSQPPEIVLAIENPFPAGSVKATPTPRGFDMALTVHLQDLNAEMLKGVQVGQHLRFSGTVGRSDNRFNTTVLPVQQEQFAVLDDPLAPLTTPPDLANTVIQLERTMCFGSCPTYRVTVYGNGVVVWAGEDNIAVPGPRITVVSTDTVRRLLAAAEKADYFGMQDSYNQYRGSDQPEANTYIRHGDRQKTVRHYYGDPSAPARLHILESQIDDLLGTAEWIGPRPWR
jgi:hypothetical protein